MCRLSETFGQSTEVMKLGLLDPSTLPVAGKEVAEKVLDPYGVPSNIMMENWRVF